MKLTIEEFDGVTVATFVDRKILEESNIQQVGRELFALSDEGRVERLILDLSNVDFMSSAMFNKLFLLQKKAKAAGMTLVLCSINSAVYQVFEITMANRLLQISADREAAIQRVQGLREKGLRFEGTCPVYQCGSAVEHRFIPQQAHTWKFSMTCAACGARLSAGGSPGAVRVNALTMETYDRESLALYPRRRWNSPEIMALQIVGRLDLFASEALEKIWYTVPTPRRVVCNLSELTELTQHGVATLRRLVESTDGDSECALWWPEPKPELATVIPSHWTLHETEKEARETLSDVPEDQVVPLVINGRVIPDAS